MLHTNLIALAVLVPGLALAQAVPPATSPAGPPLRGEAQVMGADDLSVGGFRFQLWGIDAPELNQPCFIDGIAWECGPAAARKLAEISSLGPVSCERKLDTDRTRRAMRYAACRNGTGKDVAEELVRAGMAYALRVQTDAYVAAEEAARAAKVGIWRGQSIPPWEFRDLGRN